MDAGPAWKPRLLQLRKLPLILLIATVAWSSVPAQAQESADGWQMVVEPYVMFPNMKGTVGVGILPDVDVDEDPGDIFSNLQIGAMLYLEAHNETWALTSDVLYMKLESDLSSGAIVNSGQAQLSQIGWELAALRRVLPWLELGIALTYNAIETDIDLEFNSPGGVVAREESMNENWLDPSLIARATFALGEKWFVRGRANIGGFGVGSDLMWQIQVDAGYRFSGRSYMTLGYRIIDMDYEHGSATDRFKYDITNFGPVLKFGFRF